MDFRSCEELERIGWAGALAVKEVLGTEEIVRCRALSSFWLCTNPGPDGIAEHLQKDGFWESWITYWMSVHVRPRAVCIDAGATYGYYTFFLAQHGCRVYSIEANPKLIPLLEYSNFLNGTEDRVTIINKAVADEGGRLVRLGFSDTIGGTSIKMQSEKGITVNSMILDELLVLERKIDFVKLDISASEEPALEGMKRILDVNPGCTCILEFAPGYYENKGRAFFDKLAAQFLIFYINHKGQEIPAPVYEVVEELESEWVMLVLRSKMVDKPGLEVLSLLQSLQ